MVQCNIKIYNKKWQQHNHHDGIVTIITDQSWNSQTPLHGPWPHHKWSMGCLQCSQFFYFFWPSDNVWWFCANHQTFWKIVISVLVLTKCFSNEQIMMILNKSDTLWNQQQCLMGLWLFMRTVFCFQENRLCYKADCLAQNDTRASAAIMLFYLDVTCVLQSRV